MTVLDLLTEGLQVAGISGEADRVSDARARNALACLVGMIDTANADPLKKFVRATAIYPLVPGQQSYTIGPDPSMNFNAPRPQEILTANCIDISVAQYPIRNPMRILNDDQWAAIRLRNSPTTIPDALNYDSGYTQIGSTTSGYGTINVWGVPSAANQLEIWTAQALTQAAAYTDTLIFPPSYYEWMLYGLAIRLCARYSRDPAPAVVELYKAALLVLESANCDTPILRLDSGLPGGRPPYFDARTNRQL